MASKVKKLFHRKRDEDVDESQEPTLAHDNYRREPGPRTLLYESTLPGETTQTADYAIIGNDSSVVLQPSRKHSVRSSRSRRSSDSIDNVPYRQPTPHQTSLVASNNMGPGTYNPYQKTPALPTAEQRRLSLSGLPQEFSGLNLGDEQSSTAATQAVRAPNPASTPTRGSSQAQGYNNQANIGIRKVNQEYRQLTGYDGACPREDHEAHLARQTPIPRKQVGTSPNVPHSSVQPPATLNQQQGHSRNPSAKKPLPPAPVFTNDVTGPRDAQDVVNRAKGNTYDTEVIENIAPAVVHETIHRDVHHIREERISRNIHNYDVYHRTLPIVDVEVLPPRHFLPVEGGGLVEISASEVPGRGNNWVIAETASKIPSDQAAPQRARQFTAREFRGREGDAMRYTAPEGHEVTEQTWVHPPESETGARDSGQSWPLEFGDDSIEKPSHKHMNSKSGKSKNSATQAGPAQRADGLAGEL